MLGCCTGAPLGGIRHQLLLRNNKPCCSFRLVLAAGLLMLVSAVVVELLFGWGLSSHLLLKGELPTHREISSRCTLHSCLDLRRCPVNIESNPDSPLLKVFLYDLIDSSTDFKKVSNLLVDVSFSPDFLEIRKIMQDSVYHTLDASQACLFLPPFDTLCIENNCNPPGQLLAHLLHYHLEHWNEGSNHLIFDISDLSHANFDQEKAISLRSSFALRFYRPAFDLAIPLPPKSPIRAHFILQQQGLSLSLLSSMVHLLCCCT